MADLKKFLTSPAGIIIIIVALAVFNVGGIGDKIKNLVTPSKVSGTGDGTLPCLNDGSTMTIGPMRQKWEPSGDVDHHYARVYVNGVDQGLKANGASMEVSVGDSIEVYYAENASFEYFAYTAKQKFVVPCKSDFTTGDPALDNEAYILYNSTQQDSVNLSNAINTCSGVDKIKCFSQDDGTLLADTAEEKICAGDDITIKCTLEGINKEAYSPYGNPLMCIEYVEVTYDAVEIEGRTKKPKPSFCQPSAANMTVACYEFEPIISSNTYDFKVHIDAADTLTWYDCTKPEDLENISLYLVDQDYFYNTENGKMELGYEDNDGLDVGAPTSCGSQEDYRICLG